MYTDKPCYPELVEVSLWLVESNHAGINKGEDLSSPLFLFEV